MDGHSQEVSRRESRALADQAPATEEAPQPSVSKAAVSAEAGETSKEAPDPQSVDLHSLGAARSQTAVGSELSNDELLARARARGGRFLKSFEDAVAAGWAKDLMHDPFPPPDPSKVASTQRKAPSHPSEQSKSPWDWWFGGEAPDKDGDKAKPEKTSGANAACTFEEGLDYQGEDVGTVEHLTDQGCCELCASKKQGCTVAVMSSDYDEPPKACWLKTRISGTKKKEGVRACWPASNKKAYDESK
jgi:hypothetical protein